MVGPRERQRNDECCLILPDPRISPGQKIADLDRIYLSRWACEIEETYIKDPAFDTKVLAPKGQGEGDKKVDLAYAQGVYHGLLRNRLERKPVDTVATEGLNAKIANVHQRAKRSSWTGKIPMMP